MTFFLALIVAYLGFVALVEVWRNAETVRQLRANTGLRRERLIEVPTAIRFVWAEGVRLVDVQLQLGSSLDGKISPLFALTGAALALVVTQALRTDTVIADLMQLLMLELFVVMTYLLLAFRSRGFAYAPALAGLFELANRTEDEVRTELLGNLEEAYLINLEALSVKNLYLRWATYAIAFIALTLVAAVLHLHL